MKGKGTWLRIVLGTVLVSSACGGVIEPTKPPPALAVLLIEASDSCSIGSGGIPLKSYSVTMRDRRSGNDWFFPENDDTGGPLDEKLSLQLTVFPVGMVTATTNTTTEVAGTWSGRLAAWITNGGSVQACNATDHRIRLSLLTSS